MSNGTPASLPCVTLPSLTVPSVTLPLGGSLSAMADFSIGTPSAATLSFNLMAQVTPVLASIACLVKIIGVVAALKDLAKLPPNPGPLLSALGEAAECLALVAAPAVSFGLCVVDIIKLIVTFLTAFIDELEAIVNVQLNIGLSLDLAVDDPDLLAALQCAQNNAATSLANLNAGIQGIQALISLVGIFAGIAGLSINLSITPPPPGSDAPAAVAHLKATVDKLNQIIAVVSAFVSANVSANPAAAAPNQGAGAGIGAGAGAVGATTPTAAAAATAAAVNAQLALLTGPAKVGSGAAPSPCAPDGTLP